MSRHRNVASVFVVVLAAVAAQALAGCDGRRTPQAPGAPSPLEPSGQASGAITVAGSVSDAAWRPLPGARVEVVDGPHAGRSTTADHAGEFTLSGDFDDTTRFRASKDGHVSATVPLPPACAPCNPDWWVYFNLEAALPRANLTGQYLLTIVADRRCGFPDDVGTRSFEATVALLSETTGPANSQFVVSIDAPPAVNEDYRRFSVGLAGEYAGGFVGDLHGMPGVAARIGATGYLSAGGVLAGGADVSGTELSAAMDGFVEYRASGAPADASQGCSADPATASKRCVSGNHRLILRRR